MNRRLNWYVVNCVIAWRNQYRMNIMRRDCAGSLSECSAILSGIVQVWRVRCRLQEFLIVCSVNSQCEL